MPDIAIILSRDDNYFWHFGLVVKGEKPYNNTASYDSMDAALAAAKLVLNRRGLVNV